MFHVFVEGASDATPGGLEHLADAIAKHYGLPAAELTKRLAAGRFRVKGNVDRPTAEAYVRDLERLGARCAIEEANADNARPTPLPFPAQRPATPAPVASALADQPASRPSAPPSALAGMPRASTPPPVAGAYTSGLAAAFGSDAGGSNAGLGALEREDVSFTLASVDGGDESGTASAIEKSPEPAFAVPASIGPAIDKPIDKPGAGAKKAKPKDEPLDMFAPPDAGSENFAVDIAADEKDISARKRASTPPPSEVVVPQRASSPAIPTLTRPASQPAAAPRTTVVASKLGPLANERVRMIAGTLLAVLLGFLPAHLFARSREASAYHELDRKLVAVQDSVDTPDAYAALDKTRSEFLERKREERRNIAMMALVIWALVGGGVAYGWFRRVPWDEL